MEPTLLNDIKDKLAFAFKGRNARLGMVAAFIMVAVLAGHTLASTATASDFTVNTETASLADSTNTANSADSSSEAAATESETSNTQQQLYVHVLGAVAQPGLVTLPTGSRIADALLAVGGFAQDADDASVNLAQELQDGQQIYVRAKGEEAAGSASTQPANANTAAGSEAVSASGAGATCKVNINTADSAQLQTLPGIGEATAQKILSDRQANGAFASISDITRVSGIGQKKFEAMADLICV